MKPYVWKDSGLIQESESSFLLQRSGLDCGAGVFTTLKLKDGRFENLPLHIERLRAHAQLLDIQAGPICEEYFYALRDATEAHAGAFRVKAYIVAEDALADSWKKSSFMISLEPYEPTKKEALSVDCVPFEPSDMVARIKTLSRLERRMLYIQTKAKGLDECLTYSREGYLLEGLYANLFWECEGHVYTPDPLLPLMYGITIQTLFAKLPELGYNVHFACQTLDELSPKSHLFLSNSLIHCLPIISIKNRIFKRNHSFEMDLFLILNNVGGYEYSRNE